MLTIHKQQKEQSVTIPLAEFSKLVEYCREVEPIELIDITNTCDDFNDPLPDDILEEFYK